MLRHAGMQRALSRVRGLIPQLPMRAAPWVQVSCVVKRRVVASSFPQGCLGVHRTVQSDSKHTRVNLSQRPRQHTRVNVSDCGLH